MSREPNFTPGPSEHTLTIAAPPQPPPPATAEAWAVVYVLAAEVAYLEQTGKAGRIYEAAEVRARGERLAPGSTVAGIRRKAAAMLRHCPASPRPRHTAGT